MDLLNPNAVVRLHSGALIIRESELAGWKLRRNKSSGHINLGEYRRPYNNATPNFDEVPVYTFEDTLIFKQIMSHYGRSPYAVFQGAEQEYEFFFEELNKMIPDMVNGTITGKFTFKKHGQMVSNVFVKE